MSSATNLITEAICENIYGTLVLDVDRDTYSQTTTK